MLCIKSSTCIIVAQSNIDHSWQQCHNSNYAIFQERLLTVLKCYNFLWVQWWHNCSPVVSFANCIMTLRLLKVHLQMFLSILITKECQILSCDTLVANERYIVLNPTNCTVHNNHLHDFRLPPWCRWDLHSVGILCKVK
jgi:hypothetical protein